VDGIQGVVEEMGVYLGLEQVHLNPGPFIVEGDGLGQELSKAQSQFVEPGADLPHLAAGLFQLGVEGVVVHSDAVDLLGDAADRGGDIMSEQNEDEYGDEHDHYNHRHRRKEDLVVVGLELGLIDATDQRQSLDVQGVTLERVGRPIVLEFGVLSDAGGERLHQRSGSGGSEAVSSSRLDKKGVQIVVRGQYVGDNIGAQFNVDISQLVGGVAIYRVKQGEAVRPVGVQGGV
jgi:hypothetical protein